MKTDEKFPILKFILYNSMITIIVMALFYLFPSYFHVFEQMNIDFRFQMKKRLNKSPRISPLLYNISIDDKSIQSYGPYYWNREKVAQILKKMSDSGTSVIGCDFLFSGYQEVYEDEQLINTFKESGRIVIPYAGDFSGIDKNPTLNTPGVINRLKFEAFPQVISGKNTIPALSGFQSLPIFELLENTLGSGFLNVIPDEDGTLRRYPLIAKFEDRIVPSFPLVILSAFLDFDLANMALSEKGDLILRSIKLPEEPSEQDLVIPLDRRGYMIINFSGKLAESNYPHSFSASAFQAFEDVSALKSQLSGKIGIFSNISSAGKYFSHIPLENNFPNSFIYTNIISNILNGDFIQETNIPVNLLIVSGILLIIILTGIFMRLKWFVWTTLTTLLIYYIINMVSFIGGNFLLPMFPIMLPIVVASGFSLLYKYMHETRHHQWIENNLKSYISVPFLKKIRKNPSILKPGGERKRISILCSNIANFNSFCDSADPEDIQAFLEMYDKNMADIVMNNRGIIDKYLGNGLIAFFENEEEDIISPVHALKTAVQLLKMTEEMKMKLEKSLLFELHISIGVTTGYAIVGNIGLQENMDYTAIGSKVNLASRLQALGRNGDIIMDEDTYRMVQDNCQVKNLGELDIQGFEHKINPFRLIIPD